MDRLDRYVQETLIPEYTQGKSRAVNPAYWRIQSLALRYKKTGNIEQQYFTPSPDGRHDTLRLHGASVQGDVCFTDVH